MLSQKLLKNILKHFTHHKRCAPNMFSACYLRFCSQAFSNDISNFELLKATLQDAKVCMYYILKRFKHRSLQPQQKKVWKCKVREN